MARFTRSSNADVCELIFPTALSLEQRSGETRLREEWAGRRVVERGECGDAQGHGDDLTSHYY